jgi:hypothetical protein
MNHRKQKHGCSSTFQPKLAVKCASHNSKSKQPDYPSIQFFVLNESRGVLTQDHDYTSQKYPNADAEQ